MRKVCYWAVPNGGSRKGGAIEGARLKKQALKVECLTLQLSMMACIMDWRLNDQRLINILKVI